MTKPWTHIACQGGVVWRPSSDRRPEYRCTKCGSTWTNGKGEPWSNHEHHFDHDDLTAWKEKAKIVLRGLWLRRNYDRNHPIVIDLTQRAKDLSE